MRLGPKVTRPAGRSGNKANHRGGRGPAKGPGGPDRSPDARGYLATGLMALQSRTGCAAVRNSSKHPPLRSAPAQRHPSICRNKARTTTHANGSSPPPTAMMPSAPTVDNRVDPFRRGPITRRHHRENPCPAWKAALIMADRLPAGP